ncbi:MAG: bifunctional diguanylate cyclase/phosphodiesterase [Clostridia bacterium]
MNENNISFEESIDLCISFLNEKEDVKIPSLLKILGDFYDADKTYLYMNLTNSDGIRLPCAYNWKKDDSIIIVSDLSEKMSPANFVEWLKQRNEKRINFIERKDKDFKEGTLNFEILEAFKIENLAISVIEDEEKLPLGTITMSNCRKNTNDFRLLQAVSGFLEKDVTQNELLLNMAKIAEKDILTDFYTHTYYARKIEEIKENLPKSLGIFFANINGLKKINSEFGYTKGDEFIKKATEIMQNHFKIELYRISGDEYVGFFLNVDKNEFEQSINSLRNILKKETYNLFAIGNAFDQGRYDCEQLINDAKAVMYINKQEYYSSAHTGIDEISDSTLSDLFKFLDNGEFSINLQPQFELTTGKIHGAEALIRRFDKTNNKMVFPDQFIPLYEQKSIIRHIDLFVVEEVCKLLNKWSKIDKAVPVSVNLSRVTLLEYGIVDTIMKICDKYDVPHNLLIIEVTERVGLVENNVASSLITNFKKNNFQISLDDFGCAYSNIVTLSQIEVDEIKIDKSLVDNILTNRKNYILVKNILTMCNELGNISTVTEGIEDKEQSDMLRDLNCSLAQGYFYSRPIPVSEFEEKYIN